MSTTNEPAPVVIAHYSKQERDDFWEKNTFCWSEGTGDRQPNFRIQR